MSESSVNYPNDLYRETAREATDIYHEAVRSSLNLPSRGPSVNVQNGITWRELAVMAALALGGGGLGLALWPSGEKPPAQATTPAPTVDRDTVTDLQFVD